MSLLILLRHGQSMWNKLNVFTGWVNVPLSEKGIQEALHAGEQLSDIRIDEIHTSTLMRAQQTAMIALSKHSSGKVPVLINTDPQFEKKFSIHSEPAKHNTIPTYADWRLNERFYGELQGLNKQDTRDTYGDEQVKIWRRSFDVPPPEGESLKMTKERTMPCFNERIVPALEGGKNILVSAHGNSLRSIIMSIENLSKDEILNFEIATGVPRIYSYTNSEFKLNH
jgi:2,3-bisphosphoglycerate-dependent phosphoglycerate mutase